MASGMAGELLGDALKGPRQAPGALPHPEPQGPDRSHSEHFCSETRGLISIIITSPLH